MVSPLRIEPEHESRIVCAGLKVDATFLQGLAQVGIGKPACATARFRTQGRPRADRLTLGPAAHRIRVDMWARWSDVIIMPAHSREVT